MDQLGPQGRGPRDICLAVTFPSRQEPDHPAKKKIAILELYSTLVLKQWRSPSPPADQLPYGPNCNSR